MGSVTLQKRVIESRRPKRLENVPDLTDFMNDMFFGTMDTDRKVYNLTGGGGGGLEEDKEDSFDDSTRSNSSKLTQEWLEEARRMVASSPSHCDSPARLVGSPRFAAVPGRLSVSSSSGLDRRDPLSRSARRHRATEGFSGEILVKSVKHNRNKSETLEDSVSEPSPASQVQKWFTNILKPTNITPPQDPTPNNTLPPRLSTPRKSRFQTQPIPTSRRTFKAVPDNNNRLLSPPKNLIESAHRRSISASTCSQPGNQPLSPPKNLVESANIEKIVSVWQKEEEKQRELSLNGFLKAQRIKVHRILTGEIRCKAKVILSDPSNSTSSMAAAICYAWLLENKTKKNQGDAYVVVPVMNVRRENMWKLRQVAWLFHHAGVDAAALLFADEVDLEGLMMSAKLNLLVVGQDVLRPNAEVGSQCTDLTDNFCEGAYDLLQTPVLKKLLLAGILLDTQNLNANAKLAMIRDSEAVQLLLVGSPPNYRNTLFDQLMHDQRDTVFNEALQQYYGEPPNENGRDRVVEQRGTERKSTSKSRREPITQNPDNNSNDARNTKSVRDTPRSAKPNTIPAPPAAAAPQGSHGKNKSFLAKWFGFGSK